MRIDIRVTAALMVAATGGAAAQQLPPVRQLGPVVAKTTEPLSSIAGVRATSGGVVVNDVASRRVILFDSSLTKSVLIADSTSATANAYGGRFGGLIPYRGDSTLFVDAQSMSMLVIDPAGKVARVMSVPRSQDAMAFAGGPLGSAGFDPVGRIVYRAGGMRMMRGGPGAAGPGGAGGMPHIPQPPDSAAIMRVDLQTRTVDTVAFIKIPKVSMQMNRADDGTITMTSEVNPLPVVDDWAVMPDGSIAIVRGRDYHVDWIAPDGTKRSSPKIPFEWQRLTDEDKVAFLDSVKAARERLLANGGADRAGAVAGMLGGAPPPGAQTMIVMRDGAGGGGAAPGGVNMRSPQVNFVPADQLPDYKPPFFSGAVRADAEGNLWIRTIPTKAIAGGPVYDVVNKQGELVDRVQLPQGRTIVGFGAGGVVYLTAREGDKTVLERARAK